ncbi:MAG: hypothetical protein A2Y15_02935 [Clostridiales bacterium GWF2_36_10]|nr:MAG: hypothetical protein A2Y15_02935 [Clostridiales bacterium GWF2_36_10]HAN20929.1 hypothetical protein [Clostridiales bacterium]
MAFKIMLDAGHYGKVNQSTVIPEYYESEVMWKLHLLLKNELEKFGFEVGTTRSVQTDELDETKRGRKSVGYDLFLSLHSNASTRKNADHVIVYYSYENKNNAIEFASKLSIGVATLMGVKEGSKLGTRSHEFDDGIDEYYGVLRGAKSVGTPLYYIINHSFHTNFAATRWLLVESNLKKIAKLEAGIIAAYYVNKTLFTKGDVIGDGKITAKDYLYAKRALFGTVKLTEDQFFAADIDQDNKITSKDNLKIKRAWLGTFEP